MERTKKENLGRGVKKIISFNFFLHIVQDIGFFFHFLLALPLYPRPEESWMLRGSKTGLNIFSFKM